ncbi:tyrosine-protein kinase receptor UFO-like [Hypomesus transpacificus]|uniref:tyrosine-protein kinase receptor UFO-like n=1 Tax=Hypomesus transpacificus TaxID=137520 RepID=UPI001F079140|nr:tyrosine-protein kinase receptor UFO-like [Hypomesus transpacificus]
MSYLCRWRVTLMITFLIDICEVLPVPVLRFVSNPGNMTSSLGKPVQARCSLRGDGGLVEPPDVVWLRNGETVEYADTNQVQIPVADGSWLTISDLRIDNVALSDIGSYRCMATVGLHDVLSQEGRIQLEGIPHFSVEPGDVSVEANRPFNLQCSAHGPPEPVRIIWLQNGEPLNTLQDPLSLSPSSLNVTGLNQTSRFSCEAHNSRGVATSATGSVTVIPSQAQRLRAAEATQSSLLLSWEPGFGGVYPVTVCSIQAAQSVSVSQGRQLLHNRNVNLPPALYLIPRLQPYSSYDVRVSCRSSQGASAWTPWVTLLTSEGVPEEAPASVQALFNGTQVHLNWTEPPGQLNGLLEGYRVEYKTSNMSQAVVEPVQRSELALPVSGLLETVILRVCACTRAGCGPWSPAHTLQHSQPGVSPHQVFSWHWWYVVMLVAVTLALIGFLVVYVVMSRHRQTCFGKEFYPLRNNGDFVVRYSARRSYNRQTNEATLNSLVISDELKHKLQDVMVDRHKLTLGKTLGEGEFGSVVEGLLVHGEAVIRVAVKTMKISICSRPEMEDFLREAACMKEFDHPNVMRLVGVCLQTVDRGHYPTPVVILPFMKHGDLHSFLLYSRLGDSPLPLSCQMLVKFMTDIARGMEYLSNKRFIHRDLAARNCMLNENMTVCVADFGLSKKIYNGDYYRQGNISKMPVKWIAIESLADRVYTTKSDVWSFGVTMWEIATRGQTPYPGVENSEIYDYLRQGNRLKQPLGCPDDIYCLMFSCWRLSPKDRPGFGALRGALEQALQQIPEQDEDLLYVNMEEPGTLLGAVGGWEPSGPPLASWRRGCQAAGEPQAGRYVLGPLRQVQPPSLDESQDSLSWMWSSSNTTLQLQASPSCSPPSSLTLAGQEGEEGRAASRK